MPGPNSCLIPGKLFWDRDPEESGPALLAAVSIPGPWRSGRGGLAPARSLLRTIRSPSGCRLWSTDLPFCFSPQVLCNL